MWQIVKCDPATMTCSVRVREHLTECRANLTIALGQPSTAEHRQTPTARSSTTSVAGPALLVDGDDPHQHRGRQPGRSGAGVDNECDDQSPLESTRAEHHEHRVPLFLSFRDQNAMVPVQT